MSLLLMLTISATVATGVLLALSRDLFRLIVGLAILGSATNMVVFTAARPGSLVPPLIEVGTQKLQAAAANPLPQALVLTAIVIGFALLCFALVLGARLDRSTGGDTHLLQGTEPVGDDPGTPPGLES